MYCTEGDFDTHLPRIQRFWDKQVQPGELTLSDGVILHYAWCMPEQAKGSVVISSGRIEGYLKYQEFIYELYHNGYGVFVHDHRGQGLSSRCARNPHKGHVDDFADYVSDLKAFIQTIVRPNSQGPKSLLCHSMGSAIGALMIMQHPDWFTRVVFCAPMFGIQAPIPVSLGKALARGLVKLSRLTGNEPWYFPGQGNYHALPFELNCLTHSRQRYRHFRQLYHSTPALQLGGITANWLNAALKAMADIEAGAADFPLPALVIQAGEDKVVCNQAQARVAAAMPGATLLTIEGAYHELLMEADNYRRPAIEAILDFLKQPDE